MWRGQWKLVSGCWSVRDLADLRRCSLPTIAITAGHDPRLLFCATAKGGCATHDSTTAPSAKHLKFMEEGDKGKNEHHLHTREQEIQQEEAEN